MVLTGSAIAGGALALGSAAAGIFNGIYNAHRQDSINAANLANNERLTRESWARDDSAVQRRVADLKAAGLSPVLAAGSAANTSAPISTAQTSRDVDFGDPAMAVMAALQQKANIAQTNAGIELAKFQSQSEQAKYSMMNAQAGVFDAQKQNVALQNQYFAMDMLSKINLRDKQANNLVEQAKLNVAKTLYEQTSLDKLKTETDILKIQRDVDDYNRSWLPFDKLKDYTPNGIVGQVLGGMNYFRATGKQFGDAFNNGFKYLQPQYYGK